MLDSGTRASDDRPRGQRHNSVHRRFRRLPARRGDELASSVHHGTTRPAGRRTRRASITGQPAMVKDGPGESIVATRSFDRNRRRYSPGRASETRQCDLARVAIAFRGPLDACYDIEHVRPAGRHRHLRVRAGLHSGALPCRPYVHSSGMTIIVFVARTIRSGADHSGGKTRPEDLHREMGHERSAFAFRSAEQGSPAAPAAASAWDPAARSPCVGVTPAASTWRRSARTARVPSR